MAVKKVAKKPVKPSVKSFEAFIDGNIERVLRSRDKIEVLTEDIMDSMHDEWMSEAFVWAGKGLLFNFIQQRVVARLNR